MSDQANKTKTKRKTMKLLIDKNTNKVLYAEARKDCIDFLIHVFVLPVGSAIGHLLNDATVDAGSLGNLYKSIGELSADYLHPNATKDDLLNPKTPEDAASRVSEWMINLSPDPKPPKRFYTCPNLKNHYQVPVSDGLGALCFYCSTPMNSLAKYVAPNVKRGEGYVQGLVIYMITDDLIVKPLSSSIALLHQLNVKDLGCIEEMEVTLDTDKGMALLKTSLMSKTVLTDTFLGKIDDE